MQKRFKIILCTLLVLLIISVSTYADEFKSKDIAYLLSLFIGFGAGHYYLNDASASFFLITEICAVVVTIGGILLPFILVDPFDPQASLNRAFISSSLVGLGALALFILRVCEFIDLFRAVDEAKKRGELANNSVKFAVTPTGFKINYSF